jgi:hypothetical protein
LNGLSISARRIWPNPALPASWRIRDSGSPRVPSPSPSWASEVVMQYRRENPYSSEAMGPTLSAGWSAQLTSRQRYLPPGCSASQIDRSRPSGSAESCTTSKVVMTSKASGSPAAASRTW